MPAKFGIRFILLVTLTVVIMIPLVKVAVSKLTWLPDPVESWVQSI